MTNSRSLPPEEAEVSEKGSVLNICNSCNESQHTIKKASSKKKLFPLLEEKPTVKKLPAPKNNRKDPFSLRNKIQTIEPKKENIPGTEGDERIREENTNSFTFKKPPRTVLKLSDIRPLKQEPV